jgi:glutamate---cysteine ligase / carboxylate-amine ligase
VDDLGSRKAVEHINNVLKTGTGADRQLEVFRNTGDMNAVVDYLISATLEDTQPVAAKD